MRSICLSLVLVVIVLSSIVSNCQTQGSDQTCPAQMYDCSNRKVRTD